MNDSELRELADAAARLLRPHLERSEDLRRVVALVGQWLCEEAAQARPAASVATPPPAAPVDTPAEVFPVPVASPEATSMSLVRLKLGEAEVEVPVAGAVDGANRAKKAPVSPSPFAEPASATTAEVDLEVVENRCRLKAESCRLAVERRAAAWDPVSEPETLARLKQMIARAKLLPNCYLWAFRREEQQPGDDVMLQIAMSYDAQADAVSLARRLVEGAVKTKPEEESEILHLLAESNSALRVALTRTWLTKDDSDQFEIHLWLRRETDQRRIFVGRHMTVADPADPANAAALRERIKRLRLCIDGRANRAKETKNGFNRIKYHAKKIAKNGTHDSSEDWAKIAESVAMLTASGITVGDHRIAEALGPEAAALWHPGHEPDSGPLAAVVERALALADAPEADTEDDVSPEAREWSPSVLEVRELLRGKRIVIVGGERNGAAADRFVEAFELAEAEWVELLEHGPGGPMRAPIQRPDTAIVLVIIKLTGHLHADEARAFASAAGKPCIHLSAGYNPERVAKAVLEQASTRLKG